jgi:hypothetical protein
MQGFETWPQLPTHTIYRGLHHSKIYFRLIRLRSRTQDFLINCTSCGGNIDIVNDCAVTQVQTGQCDGYWGFVFSISPYPSPAFFRHQLSSSPPPQVYLFVIDAAIIIGGRLRLRALFWLVSVLFLIGLIADQKLSIKFCHLQITISSKTKYLCISTSYFHTGTRIQLPAKISWEGL